MAVKASEGGDLEKTLEVWAIQPSLKLRPYHDIGRLS